MKKLLFGFLSLALVLVLTPLFAAFEAHVVNVTARIENALYVHPESRDFGVLFPQEYRELGVFVTFSESFSAADQTRVDTVEYAIKQKPKPRPLYVAKVGANEAQTWCENNYPESLFSETGLDWSEYLDNCYPSLCPYLSKTPANLDGNDVGVPPFHDPFATSSIAYGTINKNGAHVGDNWTIDLAAPCFEGACAQDWQSFVLGHNPAVSDPNEYKLPRAMEQELLGCNLWVEVTDVY